MAHGARCVLLTEWKRCAGEWSTTNDVCSYPGRKGDDWYPMETRVSHNDHGDGDESDLGFEPVQNLQTR